MKSQRRSLEDDAAMSMTQNGLSDFLSHISRQPYHPTLVDRYLSLAFELSTDLRRDAMEDLNRILIGSNPSLALRSNYQYIQHVRVVSERDKEEEIFVLQLIQNCFLELGRYKQAHAVAEEINRIIEDIRRSRLPPAIPVRRVALEIFDEGAKDHGLDAYEQTGQELFFEFQKHLGALRSVRHQRLAIEKIIQALDSLYRSVGSRVGDAVRTHGQNPLIWKKSREFRPELAAYFLECRVFQMGQDELTSLRMRMVLEMLVAYYDQKTLADVPMDQDRETRLRLLGDMVNIFLDAGVSFPSYVMGAS